MYSSRAGSQLYHTLRGPLFRRWASSSVRFSVHDKGQSSKDSFIQTVNQAAKQLGAVNQTHRDSLVILASRQYASWLQDKQFLSTLLDQFPSAGQRELSVLAAAVDGLPSLQPFGEISHGFSFFHGSQNTILPNLWQSNQPRPQRDSKLQAAITFHLNSWDLTPSTTTCTLPLANTIFQNGLQSTLLASRWRRSGAQLDIVQMAEQQTQDIIFSADFASSTTTVEAPLIPITAPRKILAGLGNIIRHIEVDGKATPASKELEIAVQTLLDRRMWKGHELSPGPLGVWAVVVPPATAQLDALGCLQERANRLNEDGMAEDEWKKIMDTKGLVQEFLSHGARAYRILSGGGGWGKKQGLLSLDPETKYSPSEEEDLDSFIRSFSSQCDGGAQEDVIAPGSFVQYFVSPPATAKPKLPAEVMPSTIIAFGASERALAETSPSTNGPSGWKLVPDHFGAVTSHGLFITSDAKKSKYSKLDAPDSWIGYSK